MKKTVLLSWVAYFRLPSWTDSTSSEEIFVMLKIENQMRCLTLHCLNGVDCKAVKEKQDMQIQMSGIKNTYWLTITIDNMEVSFVAEKIKCGILVTCFLGRLYFKILIFFCTFHRDFWRVRTCRGSLETVEMTLNNYDKWPREPRI